MGDTHLLGAWWGASVRPQDCGSSEPRGDAGKEAEWDEGLGGVVPPGSIPHLQADF